MVKVRRFTCENMAEGCVTDEKQPCFSYALESDRRGAALKRAYLSVGNWTKETVEQIAIPYQGTALQPFKKYKVQLQVQDDAGDTAFKSLCFETGRMDTPWQAKWISDAAYSFTEKKVSPIPMTFRKKFALKKEVKSARIYATAMGIYEISLNAGKVGDEFFAPGFTSYKTRLQYQTYDVTADLKADNELLVAVGGGWAVGSFVFTRQNRVSADRQALLLELRITYMDGSTEIIGTDESWEVTEEGNYRAADFYDGETFDASIDLQKITWRSAAVESLRIQPKIYAATGAPVKAHERMEPVSCRKTAEGLIYDFGQNFAGVVTLDIQGHAGQEIKVTHAELLHPDGSLNTMFLRTAKATLIYRCKEGSQHYIPRLTYMGFRYICIQGIEEEAVQVSALALYSEVEQIGTFHCSSERLNRLQENIVWSSKSNFMDIPTDCPQRDERMGWTGDIAVFAPTACYNFNMSRFLDKWLGDVAEEQLPTGGIPNTVPAQGYGFPATMPTMAIEFWGDACILVPWAEYQARGDRRLLEKYYPMMKKYVNACKFWAGLFSVGKHRYLWHTPATLHFGDWVAPDVAKMSQWQKRSKWTATASLQHSSALLAEIASILDREEDAAKYKQISERTADAYRSILTDGQGKLKEEFQTAYVLPLQFGIFQGAEERQAVEHLVRLVKEKDYCIGTGFPGTPYILFALADHGRADVAYEMLFNEKCPSWLYEVKMGATTIWERWDGLNEEGVCPIEDDGTDLMISYNHYASGAVGDFLYRRVAGIEPLTAGYQSFRIAPLVTERLESASGSVETPYGRIVSQWKRDGSQFMIHVEVPMGSTCSLQLPDESTLQLDSGSYDLHCPLP